MASVSSPSEPAAVPLRRRRMKTFDEDDIVQYSMSLDVPIVGLVRDLGEYKEMREIALIYGTTLGMGARGAASMQPPKEKAREEPEVA